MSRAHLIAFLMLVALAALTSSAKAIADSVRPLLTVTQFVLKRSAQGPRFQVQGETTLPSGARVNVSLRYEGAVIDSADIVLSGSKLVQHCFGPYERRNVACGAYEVAIVLSVAEQGPAVTRARALAPLTLNGAPIVSTVSARSHFRVGSTVDALAMRRAEVAYVASLCARGQLLTARLRRSYVICTFRRLRESGRIDRADWTTELHAHGIEATKEELCAAENDSTFGDGQVSLPTWRRLVEEPVLREIRDMRAEWELHLSHFLAAPAQQIHALFATYLSTISVAAERLTQEIFQQRARSSREAHREFRSILEVLSSIQALSIEEAGSQ